MININNVVKNYNNTHGEYYGRIKKEHVLCVFYVGILYHRNNLCTVTIFHKNSNNNVTANNINLYAITPRPETSEILYLNESNSYMKPFKYKLENDTPIYFESILKWNNIVISKDLKIYDNKYLELDYTNNNLKMIDEL